MSNQEIRYFVWSKFQYKILTKELLVFPIFNWKNNVLELLNTILELPIFMNNILVLTN
jgi:hypothetical protein